MRLAEILLFTLGGVWQGIRQDFNLLEIIVLVLARSLKCAHGYFENLQNKIMKLIICYSKS